MKAKILTALTSVDLNADDAKECKVRLRRWVSSPKAGEDSAGDAWTSWVKFLAGAWLGSGCVFKTAPAYGKGSRSLQQWGSQRLVIVLCTLCIPACLTFSLVLPTFGSILKPPYQATADLLVRKYMRNWQWSDQVSTPVSSCEFASDVRYDLHCARWSRLSQDIDASLAHLYWQAD